MEFLTEYGLFIAKTITLLIALVIAVAIIASTAHKGKGGDDDQIEIEKINDRLKEYHSAISSAVLSDDENKALKKAEKKKLKEEKKSKKNNKSSEEAKPKKRVFVTEFDGDVKASDTETLRKLITVIMTQATEADEIVIKLESSGGMVHSYGLASSQLSRITAKNIPLTVCVDKVAASGGYMMACVANKILAAPFAIIGSIGVIAQIPNFNRLLKKSNIDYEMHTAGEYKRTLTMFGENSDKGREKFVEELEDTHLLFKDFVSENRPSLDITKVATGEIWFGRRAIEQGLIDEIKTSDQYLVELAEDCDVYELSIAPQKTIVEKLGINVESALERAIQRVFSVFSTRYF